MKKLLIFAIFVSSISTFAAEPSNSTAAPMAKQIDPAKKEQLKSDREVINNSCIEESKIAGCGNEKVGTGLIRCIHNYRREHKKDFKVSEACKLSMQKLRTDKANR